MAAAGGELGDGCRQLGALATLADPIESQQAPTEHALADVSEVTNPVLGQNRSRARETCPRAPRVSCTFETTCRPNSRLAKAQFRNSPPNQTSSWQKAPVRHPLSRAVQTRRPPQRIRAREMPVEGDRPRRPFGSRSHGHLRYGQAVLLGRPQPCHQMPRSRRLRARRDPGTQARNLRRATWK